MLCQRFRASSHLSRKYFLQLLAVLADTVSKLESMIIGRHAKITLEDLPRRRPFALNDSSIHYSTVNNVVTDRGAFINQIAAPDSWAVWSCASVHVHSFGLKHVCVVRT